MFLNGKFFILEAGQNSFLQDPSPEVTFANVWEMLYVDVGVNVDRITKYDS